MQREIAMVTGMSCNGGSLALHTQCCWWRVVSEGDLDLICSSFELLLEYFRPRERRDKNLLRPCYVWSLANSRFTQLGNAVWPFSWGHVLYPQRRKDKEHSTWAWMCFLSLKYCLILNCELHSATVKVKYNISQIVHNSILKNNWYNE